MTSRNDPALRIAVVANTSWYLYNFRRNLMRALGDDGHQVVAVGGDGAFAQRLREQGYEHRAVPFSGAGTRPWRELATVQALRRVLRDERIDLVLSYTPKGNLYAALAGRSLPITQLMNVSGLGRASTSPGVASRVVDLLYRRTVSGAAWVFFQNEEDRRQFIDKGYVPPERTSRLPGSGVDLGEFVPAPLPSHEAGTGVFLMVARLLWDKGVGEYVEAARALRTLWPRARFQLLGPLDASPRSGVPRAALDAWVAEGVIEYLGQTDDIRPCLHAADCVVLPSAYREGVPRSLLEAAASMRPVITTDSVGCRDAVDRDVSGLLCRPKDAADLAQQMNRFLSMTPAQREAMGAAGRQKMEREFDERIVIDAYRGRVAALAGNT
ncbi:MAG: glycosyltransferase family 4 protein [Proteobacteria bacterium]|nr:glycosyltransferase family 4 protein [Pseudomonadota bacterium]